MCLSDGMQDRWDTHSHVICILVIWSAKSDSRHLDSDKWVFPWASNVVVTLKGSSCKGSLGWWLKWMFIAFRYLNWVSPLILTFFSVNNASNSHRQRNRSSLLYMAGLKIIKRIYAKIISSGDGRFTTAEIDLKGRGAKYLLAIPGFRFQKKYERKRQ